MSGGVNAPGQMTLQDFLRLYAPTVLPQASPVQSSGLAALGSQPAQQPTAKSMGFTSNMGQGQGQQSGPLPFLGQGSQQSAAGAQSGGQAQPGQGGLQQLLINAMNNNGPNGSSNRLADAIGFTPFGTGSFG